MSQRKLQVFVSSTYTDLKDERQAAVTAILQQGHIPAGMELFAAGDEEQMEVIKRWIEESDVFMLILGARYGSVNPSGGKSYIQLEYEYALKLGKPLFAILLSPEYCQAKVQDGERKKKEIFEQANKAAFAEFEKIVTSRLCARAHNLGDIPIQVANSLRDIEQRHDLQGWQRSRPHSAALFNNRAMSDYTSSLIRELEGATRVDAIGIGNNVLTQDRPVDFYRAFMARGGTMRILFSEPNSEAIRARELAEGRKAGSLTYTVVHNVEDMRRFISTDDPASQPADHPVDVRFYDSTPILNMIIIDQRVAFVHYYGSCDRGQDVPCLITRDAGVIRHFQKEFDFVWNKCGKPDWSAWDDFKDQP